MRSIRTLPICLVTIALLFLNGATLNAEQRGRQTREITVGQKGDVTLTTETMIGDISLKPGRYYMEHRVEGSLRPRRVEGHYIHFTEVTAEEHQRRKAVRDAISGHVISHPGEIECQVEALKKPASKTTIYTIMDGAVPRITRIEIAGESVAHTF